MVLSAHCGTWGQCRRHRVGGIPRVYLAHLVVSFTGYTGVAGAALAVRVGHGDAWGLELAEDRWKACWECCTDKGVFLSIG